MKLIEQSYEILSLPSEATYNTEIAGRTCYKSEDKITADSADKFAAMLLSKHHDAMIEFAGDLVVKFITNRGVSHELVRHRLCSFAQESTRYVNYGGTQIEFIRPVWVKYGDPGEAGSLFLKSCLNAEYLYNELLSKGWTPQQAREVLPNALKTAIVVKANLREWRHIFKLRCNKAAHPQMIALMKPLLNEVRRKIPVIFDDVED